jgi:hypothetical protein
MTVYSRGGRSLLLSLLPDHPLRWIGHRSAIYGGVGLVVLTIYCVASFFPGGPAPEKKPPAATELSVPPSGVNKVADPPGPPVAATQKAEGCAIGSGGSVNGGARVPAQGMQRLEAEGGAGGNWQPSPDASVQHTASATKTTGDGGPVDQSAHGENSPNIHNFNAADPCK